MGALTKLVLCFVLTVHSCLAIPGNVLQVASTVGAHDFVKDISNIDNELHKVLTTQSK